MPTNHGAFEWIKVPDPNNPGSPIKKWVRDSWARQKLIAFTKKFETVITVTGNTDINGNLKLFNGIDKHVICIWGSNLVFVPFVFNSNTYAKVMQTNTTHTAVANTSVTAYYIAV